MKTFLLVLILSGAAFAQSATYNPTALTDYSPCTTLYLSVYHTCLYDTVPFSGSGTNTPPTQYDTDSKAAMNRVVPLDATGAPCSGPPYAAGCRIVVITLGMSIAGRDSCYGTPNGTLATACVNESFICQSLGPLTSYYPTSSCTGGTGNSNVKSTTDADGTKVLWIVNCGQESQQLEQWQNDTNSNYTRCNTEITNNTPGTIALTAKQVEVVIFMGVDTSPEGGHAYVIPAVCCDIQHLINGADTNHPGDTTCDSRDYSGTNYPYPPNGGGTYPSTSPKSTTQIDLCMYMANLGLVSRYIKTFAYPNTQQIFWNTINYTGWNTQGGAQPEPFAYETGFGVRNSIMAQYKQKLGSYSSPAWNLMTLDVNYDCNGNISSCSGHTSCTCNSSTCGANQTLAWPCAPLWEWGNYEWAPACPGEGGASPGGNRTDGFCWNLADFTATDYVHPKSLGTSTQAGIMKVNTGMLVSGSLVGGSVSYYLNSPYAAWFQNVTPPPPPPATLPGLNGTDKLDGAARVGYE